MFIDRYTMIDTEYTLINKKDKVSLPSQSLHINWKNGQGSRKYIR